MQYIPDWRSLALVLRRLASSDQQQADAGFQRFWHACIAPAGREDKEIALQAMLTAAQMQPMTCRVSQVVVVVSLGRSTMLSKNQYCVRCSYEYDIFIQLQRSFCEATHLTRDLHDRSRSGRSPGLPAQAPAGLHQPYRWRSSHSWCLCEHSDVLLAQAYRQQGQG